MERWRKISADYLRKSLQYNKDRGNLRQFAELQGWYDLSRDYWFSSERIGTETFYKMVEIRTEEVAKMIEDGKMP